MTSHPRLRPNLRFVEQTQDGTTVHIVKDPVAMKYFRFGAREIALMQLMNGERSLAELAEEARQALGLATSPGAVERFVHRLKEMGLVERTQEERSALLMEFARRSRADRMRGHGRTLWRMRFSLGDPDVLLGRLNHALAAAFTRPFVIASFVLFLMYALIVTTHWTSFTSGVSTLYTPQTYTLSFVVLLYATALTIFLIHEFGHGVACKHYGGEVHEMGVMLIYFMPAFYCNVNDAWTFERRSDRLWVTFAGGWIQLILASFAALLWISVQPGSLLYDVAFMSLLIGGGMTVLLNFNPLIPLDGYYALVDWLGIPNLRARASEYVGAVIRKRLLRADTPVPTVTPREARIFLVYGTLSQLYIIMILSLLALGIGRFMGNHWGGWGLAAFAFLLWRMTSQQRHRLARSLSAVRVRESARRIATRVPPRYAIPALLLVVLAFLLPWTIRVSGTAIVEAPERLIFRAAEDARVASVLVREGDRVAAGSVLAVMRNPELELEWTRTQAAVAALERAVSAAFARGDRAAQRAAELELSADRDMLERLHARREALVLRAPAAGQVVTAHADELLGATFEAGDSVLAMYRAGLQARVFLPERDAADLERGDVARMKFPVQPASTWHSTIATVGSAARDGNLELIVPLTRSHTSILRPGMAGVAKIAVRRTNISGALMRSLRRTIRTDLWL